MEQTSASSLAQSLALARLVREPLNVHDIGTTLKKAAYSIYPHASSANQLIMELAACHLEQFDIHLACRLSGEPLFDRLSHELLPKIPEMSALSMQQAELSRMS
jgi:hypothetical protein